MFLVFSGYFGKVMKKISLLLLLSLASCSGVKEVLGLKRTIPDEFEVPRPKPLTLPTDEKKAPLPGSGTRSEKRKTLDDLLFRGKKKSNGTHRGEKKLLKALGHKAEKNIKESINKEAEAPQTGGKKAQETLKKVVMFWKSHKKKPGKIIQAKDEKERLEKHGVPT